MYLTNPANSTGSSSDLSRSQCLSPSGYQSTVWAKEQTNCMLSCPKHLVNLRYTYSNDFYSLSFSMNPLGQTLLWIISSISIIYTTQAETGNPYAASSPGACQFPVDAVRWENRGREARGFSPTTPSDPRIINPTTQSAPRATRERRLGTRLTLMGF